MSRSLTLYYRSGCHLCEQMLNELRGLYGKELPVTLIDVDGDESLQLRYGHRVPVLVGGDHVLSGGRLDHASVEAYLAGS